jgi:anti-sigma B factor antagonist
MQVERKDGVAVIATEERLDALVAPDLKETVRKLVEESSLTKIVIDLDKTKFIDSSGCGALVASLRVLMKNNGDMKIARPTAQAKSLFELTRLHRVFEIFEDIDAALRSFSHD